MTHAESRTPGLEDAVTVQFDETSERPAAGEVVMTLADVAVAFSGRTATVESACTT